MRKQPAIFHATGAVAAPHRPDQRAFQQGYEAQHGTRQTEKREAAPQSMGGPLSTPCAHMLQHG